MVDRVGQQFGNYRLIRLLGRGGFAEVYLGEHLRLNTQSAIKLLHTQLADKEVVSFLNEAQTIARMEHPNIVRVFDFDVSEGVPFLVMSYAPNGTLRQRHAKGTRLPAEIILSYILQVAAALQYAHDEKLIHRDIKPENMLLDRRNQVLLSDFGIALIMQSSRYQSFQEVAGTVSYMAPEQIQGKPRPASDQYALGVVIYEWLCGIRPFQGSFTEIATQQVLAAPPPLHEKLPGISPFIEQVVLKALAKDPHQRFVSVQEFAAAFDQACQSSLTINRIAPVSQTDILSEPSMISSHLSLSSSPTAPLNQLSLPYSQTTPSDIDPKRYSQIRSPGSPHVQKSRVSRRVILAGLAGMVGAGGGIIWLLTGGINSLLHGGSSSNPTNLTLAGSVISVDLTNHTVTLNVNGQTRTINNVPSDVLTNLQSQVGKEYIFQVTQNSDGSLSLQSGTNVTPQSSETPTTNQTASVNKPGSIDFIGSVQSVSSSNIVVRMPDGSSLSMSIVSGQTDLSTFYGAQPSVGQVIMVRATVNNGSFTALQLQPTNSSDLQIQNTVIYQGVTTQMVGSDRVIHLTVGNRNFSYPIVSTAELKDFNGNAQSIGNGTSVKVKVQFNGTSGSALDVSNNGQ
jgi:serine/threonine protein kinase